MSYVLFNNEHLRSLLKPSHHTHNKLNSTKKIFFISTRLLLIAQRYHR